MKKKLFKYWTSKEKQRLEKDFKAGMSYTKIAEKYGISTTTISVYIREQGLTRDRLKSSPSVPTPPVKNTPKKQASKEERREKAIMKLAKKYLPKIRKAYYTDLTLWRKLTEEYDKARAEVNVKLGIM